MRRYQERVTTNCRYLSGSPDDAEDLAQEVFMKVFFGLAGFEGRSSFNTEIVRVVTTAILVGMALAFGLTLGRRAS